jgi:hypothetical protein
MISCGREEQNIVSGAVNLKQKTSSASARQQLKACTHMRDIPCALSFEPAAQFYSFQLKADLHSGGQSSTISAKQKAAAGRMLYSNRKSSQEMTQYCRIKAQWQPAAGGGACMRLSMR